MDFLPVADVQAGPVVFQRDPTLERLAGRVAEAAALGAANAIEVPSPTVDDNARPAARSADAR